MAWSCHSQDWAILAAAMISSSDMRRVRKRHSRRASGQRFSAISSFARSTPGDSATRESSSLLTGAGFCFRL